MKIAIYSRKSKLTETGESIENQIRLCREYAQQHFQVKEEDLIVYEDEGFSGGNTQRPEFQQLLKDVRTKQFQVLICYRLDRVSRSISDFSSLINELERYDISFVSIREQFDTSTPMGKAMMYIASVFAQLERDTIAERIRDNMAELAKAGRYLSGHPPQGYKIEKKYHMDKNGHKKHSNALVLDEVEAERVRDIFDKYYEWQSIKKIETYLMQNNIKTRKGFYYKCISIRRILTHPIYMCADQQAFLYLQELGCQVFSPAEEFTGEYGINVFRRMKGTDGSVKENDPSEWIITVGKHEPLVSSEKWIKIQQIIEGRRGLTFRRPTGKNALLSGLLKCGNCGDHMRPFSISGERFYYICVTKESSKKQLCDMKNIRGDKLDKELMEQIIDTTLNMSSLQKQLARNTGLLSKQASKGQDKSNEIQQQIKVNEKAIGNLVKKLAESEGSVIEKYISDQIEELHEKNSQMKSELQKLKSEQETFNAKQFNIEIMQDSLRRLQEKDLDFTTKRNLLKNIVREIVWDGEEIHVEFLTE